jgi:integrase/recombinase XerD
LLPVLAYRKEVVAMLEKYFVKPQTVDRVRACWIGAEIERYVEWLCEREYAARTVWYRVPILVEFGEFSRVQGADTLADLPIHVDAFVARWAAQQHRRHPRGGEHRVGREVRGPIEQCCVWLCPVSTAAVDRIDGLASPTRSRGSSSTWPTSVVFGRHRFVPTDTIWTASRTTWRVLV